MSHLFEDPKDISVLKAYWINHSVDQSDRLQQTKKSNKRQACVAVYGVDIHPDGTRFATCGADEKIKIWSMAPILSADVEVTECVDKLLCVCQYDKSQVNKGIHSMFNNTIHCVRWSHDGRYLASGSADGVVTIWRLETDPNSKSKSKNSKSSLMSSNFNGFATNQTTSNVEHWVVVQHLTRHRDEANSSDSALTTDVQDIAWSPDDTMLVSAGSDNNIIIWTKAVQNNNNNLLEFRQILRSAHSDIILGVDIDPMGRYIHSQSADGTAKIWKWSGHGFVEHLTIDREFKKRSQFIQKNAGDALSRLDVCQRGSWSPDGMHLLTSFGVTEDNIFISPMYHRKGERFENEMSFVGHSKPTTVSRWSPRIYKSIPNSTPNTSNTNSNKKDNQDNSTFFVAAIGSMDKSLSIWTSHSSKPIIIFRDIGRESILDISWSRTGDILMASTHDGNVFVAIFGSEAFRGRRLGVAQHCEYIQRVHSIGGGALGVDISPQIMGNIQRNLTLGTGFRFNQIKARDKEVNSEEKAEELAANGSTNLEVEEPWLPTEELFGPQEGVETNLEVSFQPVKFDAIQGKQGRQSHMTDFYDKHNGQVDSDRPMEPTPVLSVKRRKKKHKHGKHGGHSSSLEAMDVERSDHEKSARRKKRKRDHEHKDHHHREKKKRRKETRLPLPNTDRVEEVVQFQHATLRVCSVGNEQTNTSTVQQDIHNQRTSWKTQIPALVTAIAFNDRWSFVGTASGELYCFGANGRMLLPAVQMGDGVVALAMSPRYTRSLRHDVVYVLMVAADCTLRVWKLDLQDGFEPEQVIRTDFKQLIRMHKSSVHNATVTAQGKVLLTLANGDNKEKQAMFVFQQKMDCWMRITDDRYSLSSEAIKTATIPQAEDHKIGTKPPSFSALLSAMKNCQESGLNVVNNSANVVMHTISHLEQQIAVMAILDTKDGAIGVKRRDHAFGQLLNRYCQRLAELEDYGKLEEVFGMLLSQYGKRNNWPGTVSKQRQWLQVMLQSNSGRQGNSQLQVIIRKCDSALRAILDSEAHDDSI